MVNIYVLRLFSNKYYIGKTNKNINVKFIEHLSGQGSEWTRKYKPIDIIEIIENGDDFDEDKTTKKYMSIYGIDNVRGGAYISINLLDYQIECLKKEINLSKNKCFNCGSYTHFVNNCSNTVNNNVSNAICFRCGRMGHFANNCYTNFDIDGDYIIENCLYQYKSDEKCYRCKRTGHWANECYVKIDINGKLL